MRIWPWLVLAGGLVLSVALTLLVDGLWVLLVPIFFVPALWPRGGR